MIGTAMPEASINEDGDFESWEGDVGDSARSLQNRMRDPIAQAIPMQFAPDHHFRASSLLANPRKTATCFW